VLIVEDMAGIARITAILFEKIGIVRGIRVLGRKPKKKKAY